MLLLFALLPAIAQAAPGTPPIDDAARLAHLAAALQATSAPADHLTPDLRRLVREGLARTGKRPAGLRIHGDRVQVEVLAPAPEAARAALGALGLTGAGTIGHVVAGWLPIGALPAAARLPGVRAIRPSFALARAGAVASEGDGAMASDSARSTFGIYGNNIKVGILSDSFNCLHGRAAGVASHDLPSSITILKELPDCGAGHNIVPADEGRAMAEIIHDVAPGASILFYTGFDNRADFAHGIDALRAAGASIIVDDVAYPVEPFFQDGLVAQAVDAAVAQGVAYFSAAGNAGTEGYGSAFHASTHAYPEGTGKYHAFDVTDRVFQAVDIPVGEKTVVTLEWDDPSFSVSGAPGAASDLDIHLSDAAGNPLAGGIGNNLGADPIEVMAFENDGTIDADANGRPDTRFYIAIGHRAGPMPGRFKWVAERGLTLLQDWAGREPTLVGQANSANAFAVGAANFARTPAFGVTPPEVAGYSAHGGTPILFDAGGSRLATPVVRSKPDAIAPDGVSTTFFGVDDPETPEALNFYGTSAAAPHAAGVAALLRAKVKTLTPAQVYARMKVGAIDVPPTGPDADAGAGLIQATTVLANGSPPVANAGEDVSVSGGGAVTVKGTASTDPDGDIATYRWTQLSGPTVTLATPSGKSTKVTTPAVASDQVVTLQLKVKDQVGRSSTDDVVVRVRGPSGGPIARAGVDKTVSEGGTVKIGLTATARDFPIASYQWRQLSGPPATIGNIHVAAPNVVSPVISHDQMLVFEVTVTDGNGAIDTDRVVVTETNVNQPPSVIAGPDIEVFSGQLVHLVANAADPEGGSLSYRWECVADGLQVKTRQPTRRDDEFVAPEVDTDTLVECHITVTDSAGQTAADRTDVTVHQDFQPPVLVGIDLGAGAVDLSSGTGYLPITLEATDDRSGAAWISVSLRTPSGRIDPLSAYVAFSGGGGGANAGMCPSPNQDPLLSCAFGNINFNHFVENGTWTINSVLMYDGAGNYDTMSTADVTAAGLPTTFQVTGAATDLTPPTLADFQILTPSLDETGSGTPYAQFQVTANDASSGTLPQDVYVDLRSPGGSAVYSGQAIVGGCDTGPCRVDVPMNVQAENGTWTVDAVRAYDHAGNIGVFDRATLQSRGFATTLVVNSFSHDSAPPVLDSLFFWNPKLVVNGSDTSQIVEFNAHDAGGFVYLVEVKLRSPSGYATPSASNNVYGSCSPCRLTVPINRWAQDGDWTLDSLTLHDGSGNTRVYSTSDLANLGLPTTFQVVND